MELTRLMCPSSNHSIKCPYSMIAENLTIHNTANKASAMSEVSYMIGNSQRVSFHYAVDDYRVVQGIETNRNSWNAGDGANGTGNRKSISIEICYSKTGGDKFIKAEQNAAEFTAYLLKERGWGIDRVKKHQDWSGKYCPHRTLDMGWTRFLNMIQTHLYSFDIKDIDNKKIVLTQDTYLYNFDNELATEVKMFQRGTILEASAIATTTNGTSYYLTEYSFGKNINNGFSISFCKDYIEPVIEEIEEPILEPIIEVIAQNIDNIPSEEIKPKEVAENVEIESVSEDVEPIIIKNEPTIENVQDNTQDISKIETKNNGIINAIINLIIKLINLFKGEK